MSVRIESAVETLERYRVAPAADRTPDRPEIVTHATLSAYIQHWPAEANAAHRDLLEHTQDIKTTETSRWLMQRRIALATLAKELVP